MAGIQIPIEVVDKFSKQLNDLDKKMGTLTDAAKKQNSTFNILASDVIVKYGREAAGAIIAFGKDAVKSFAESEEATSRLKVAMQNLGVYSDAALSRQLRLSEALQKTTAFSDEQATGVQTQLTSFGLYGKELEKVTRLTLDLAAGQKIDASQAAQLLGKAYVGQTGTLSRLGITFDDTGTRAQKFASIQEGLQKRFGGAAAAELQTYNGQVKALANAWDQVKEKIGADLIGSVKGAHGPLLQLVEDVDKNYESIKRWTMFVARASISPFSWVTNGTAYFKDLSKAQDEALAKGTAAFNADKKGREAGKPASAKDPELEASRAKSLQEIDDAEWAAAETGRIKAESYLLTSQQIGDMEAQRTADELISFGNNEAAKQVLSARSVEIERALNASRIANISSTLNFISTLQNAKSKELVAIGKAAAIIDTTIHTAVAVMGAYRAFSWIPVVGPALGAAAAGIVATAGAAQIAMISGMKLREGGLVPGSASGMQATIGEDGRTEAVIPLEDSRAMNRIGRAISSAGGTRGGGVNVNVGGINITVNGEAPNLRSLAAKLAEEVRAETVDAITLSLRMANLSSLNAGMAA